MAEEQTVKTGEQAGAPPTEQKPAKNKKINKLSLDEISQRVDELQKINQINSRYYEHLLQRRNELQPRSI